MESNKKAPPRMMGSLLILKSDSDIEKVVSYINTASWRNLSDTLYENGFRNLCQYYLEIEHIGTCLFTHLEYIGGTEREWDEDFTRDLAAVKQSSPYRTTSLLLANVMVGTHLTSDTTIWGSPMEELFNSNQYPVKYVPSLSMSRPPKYVASAIYLVEGKYEEYKHLHADVWKPVLRRIYDSNIRNYMIYYDAATALMFSHFEYIGSDFKDDMALIASDDTTKEWWAVCEPCQRPLRWEGPPPSQGGDGGAWWAQMTLTNQTSGRSTQYLGERP